MAYDDVILRMGEFGRYQRRIYFLLCLPAISCAFHKIAGVFLSAEMDARCLLPDEDPENATFYLPPHVMNASFPWDHGQEKLSLCHRWNVPINDTMNRHVDTSQAFTVDAQRLVPCETYVYDRSKYKSTTISEWNLVCDKAWLKATGDSLFMVGVMLGSMIFGGLSDKFGRRPIFFLSLVIQLVGGILVAVSPEFISYVIFRLIVGSTTSGVFLVAYVIALEMVGPKKRLVAGVGCQLFFTTGYILTAAFAYFITDWRMLQVAITVPSVAFLLYWWFIPESARWLLTKGRTQEAKDLLQRASLENGVDMPSEVLDTLLNNNSEDSVPDYKKPSLFDLFRYPNLRRKSCLIFFNWLVNSGTYYGLSWHVSNLGGNDYVNFVISGLVEIPAYTFLIFTLNRWGRKLILCGCMLISGIAMLAILLVPADASWLVVCLAMIGKLTITSSYGAIYVFTAEQFPTVIRNVGLGASSTFARIGGVIAPYVILLSKIWMPLPFLIFGSCVLLGGALSLLLPETLNKKLPESIQDGELFGKKLSKKEKQKQLEIEQLNEVDVLKPLKPQENGVHEKQNG
ncbi:organic cation transporter protein-like [Ceratina calcarata]|uniref:Organic cation transporter protein-like n=1 Tax=Ceratina calcarata TaxID=156304 RepID=A0AAJ7S8M9_9HYME|nr:organic cation transporter protein-like [Ceratina calcarata]XP_026672741.1 organic cation transporter protein-like [Ceratina calcarata]XP_026672742.1 organic cation transporter protein-like [Ceratina calcarata]